MFDPEPPAQEAISARQTGGEGLMKRSTSWIEPTVLALACLVPSGGDAGPAGSPHDWHRPSTPTDMR